MKKGSISLHIICIASELQSFEGIGAENFQPKKPKNQYFHVKSNIVDAQYLGIKNALKGYEIERWSRVGLTPMNTLRQRDESWPEPKARMVSEMTTRTGYPSASPGKSFGDLFPEIKTFKQGRPSQSPMPTPMTPGRAIHRPSFSCWTCWMDFMSCRAWVSKAVLLPQHATTAKDIADIFRCEKICFNFRQWSHQT